MLISEFWETTDYSQKWNDSKFLPYWEPVSAFSPKSTFSESVDPNIWEPPRFYFPGKSCDYGVDKWFWYLTEDVTLKGEAPCLLAYSFILSSINNLHLRATYEADINASNSQIKEALLSSVLQKFYSKNSNVLCILIFLNRLDSKDSSKLCFSLDVVLLFDPEQPPHSSLIKTILIPQDYSVCYLRTLKITSIANDSWHWHRLIHSQFWHNSSIMTNTCSFIHSINHLYIDTWWENRKTLKYALAFTDLYSLCYVFSTFKLCCDIITWLENASRDHGGLYVIKSPEGYVQQIPDFVATHTGSSFVEMEPTLYISEIWASCPPEKEKAHKSLSSIEEEEKINSFLAQWTNAAGYNK